MVAISRLRRTHRAGRHADDRFWATYRPWRRKARFGFVIVALLTMAMMMSFALIWPSWRQFVAGCTVGILVAMYVCLIDSPPEWIDRKRRGRDGERRTEQRLRPLERRGWQVAHDIDTGRGNIDHVVVGPPGVYLLETKNLTGEASVANGILTITRGDDDRDAWRSDSIGRTVKRSAIELRNELQKRIGVRWVQGVVVLWCDFPAGWVESESVVYLHGDRLHDWLHSQPARLGAEVLGRAGSWCEHLHADGPVPRAAVDGLASGRDVAPCEAVRRRRGTTRT